MTYHIICNNVRTYFYDRDSYRVGMPLSRFMILKSLIRDFGSKEQYTVLTLFTIINNLNDI